MNNILALTSWSYKDALVQTYTLPYLRIIRQCLPEGSKIFLVTFEQPHLRMSGKESRKTKEQLLSENIILHALEYTRFGFRAMLNWFGHLAKLYLLCKRENVTTIHAFCTPAGGAGYLLSKTTGTPLIIDSYEPHAEAMVENGTWAKNSLAFRILFLLEALQTRRAIHLIATTRRVHDYAVDKFHVKPKSFFAKPACVDLDKFSFKDVKDPQLVKKYHLEDKIVAVYAGKLGGIYLEQEVFDFFKTAHSFWKDRLRILLLTNTTRSRIQELARRSGLDTEIIIQEFVPHHEIPKYIGLGDFAVNPVKPVPTKKYCTSIKDGEYWAMGLPVVITPDISDDSDIIRQYRIGSVVANLDNDSYLKSIQEIDKTLRENTREELYERIRAIAEKYRNFSIAEEIYKRIYTYPSANSNS